VAAAGRAVGQPKHDVDVKAGHSGANSITFAAPQASAGLVACVLAGLSDLPSSDSALLFWIKIRRAALNQSNPSRSK
jgi:hypothetical protein